MARLLLVEDDKSLSVGIIYYLNKLDFDITHCEDILSAREKLQSQSFDIVLLDITLPDGESYELVEVARKDKNTPVIFLTAKDEESDIIKGFNFGADDYITKPFSLKILELRIKRLLKRNEENNIKCKKSGDLLIDIESVKLFKKQKLIDLTRTEYKLINYFMDNYNKNLTREELLEYLWDSDADFQAYSTISVYINRLREKIEDDPQRPKYIVTKRGSGYRWSVEVS